jgi:hypothetical protein
MKAIKELGPLRGVALCLRRNRRFVSHQTILPLVELRGYPFAKLGTGRVSSGYFCKADI